MWDWFQDPPMIPTSEDAQIPHIKWHRTRHRIGPPHLCIPSWVEELLFAVHIVEFADAKLGMQRADCIVIEKGPSISGSSQSNGPLFKGQLYSVFLSVREGVEQKSRDLFFLSLCHVFSMSYFHLKSVWASFLSSINCNQIISFPRLSVWNSKPLGTCLEVICYFHWFKVESKFKTVICKTTN